MLREKKKAGQVGGWGDCLPGQVVSGRGRGDLGGKSIPGDAMLRGLGAFARDCTGKRPAFGLVPLPLHFFGIREQTHQACIAPILIHRAYLSGKSLVIGTTWSPPWPDMITRASGA